MIAEEDSDTDPDSDPGGGPLDQAAQRNLTPPTPEEYARWLKEYRAGVTSPARLSRVVKASLLRTRHAVRVGWPDKNLPALKDRAAASDDVVSAAVHKAKAAAEAHAAELVAGIMVGTWEDAAKAQLAAAASITEALTTLAQRLAQAAAAATFVSYRRVPDRDPTTGVIRRDARGNPVTILKEHVSAAVTAAAAARLATAAKDHAALSRALLSSVAPGEPQGALVGPPSVVLYMPDNRTGPGSATSSDDDDA